MITKRIMIFALFFSLEAVAAEDKDCSGRCSHELFGMSSPKLAGVISQISEETDPLKVRSTESPQWLEAIGLIKLTNRDGSTKRCNVNLLTDRPRSQGSMTVVGVGHCFKGWRLSGKYKVHDNEIEFQSKNDPHKIVKVNITEILGEIEQQPGDYALFKISAFIPREIVEPLIISPFILDALMTDDKFRRNGEPILTITGNSNYQGKGNGGEDLTYHEDCEYDKSLGYKVYTNCVSYNQSSGGGAVVSVNIDAETVSRRYQGPQNFLVGLIKGNPDGTNSETVLTPTTHFSGRAKPLIAKANKDANKALMAQSRGKRPNCVAGVPVFEFPAHASMRRTESCR